MFLKPTFNEGFQMFEFLFYVLILSGELEGMFNRAKEDVDLFPYFFLSKSNLLCQDISILVYKNQQGQLNPFVNTIY